MKRYNIGLPRITSRPHPPQMTPPKKETGFYTPMDIAPGEVDDIIEDPTPKDWETPGEKIKDTSDNRGYHYVSATEAEYNRDQHLARRGLSNMTSKKSKFKSGRIEQFTRRGKRV